MESFDRIGTSPIGPDGMTVDTVITLPGGSTLRVFGGSPCSNFRLKFDNMHGEGWWIEPEGLDRLIAELLYIRRDIRVALDVEAGTRALTSEPPAPEPPAGCWSSLYVSTHPESAVVEIGVAADEEEVAL